MANRKIPDDAFEFYLSLGPGRSYQTVADRYSVTKRTVTTRAAREGWQERLAEHERKERRRREAARAEETLSERALRVARSAQENALAALSRASLDPAMAAASVLLEAIRLERLVRGEPTARIEVRFEGRPGPRRNR